MARQRLYATNAARQAAYRKRGGTWQNLTMEEWEKRYDHKSDRASKRSDGIREWRKLRRELKRELLARIPAELEQRMEKHSHLLGNVTRSRVTARTSLQLEKS